MLSVKVVRTADLIAQESTEGKPALVHVALRLAGSELKTAPQPQQRSLRWDEELQFPFPVLDPEASPSSPSADAALLFVELRTEQEDTFARGVIEMQPEEITDIPMVREVPLEQEGTVTVELRRLVAADDHLEQPESPRTAPAELHGEFPRGKLGIQMRLLGFHTLSVAFVSLRIGDKKEVLAMKANSTGDVLKAVATVPVHVDLVDGHIQCTDVAVNFTVSRDQKGEQPLGSGSVDLGGLAKGIPTEEVATIGTGKLFVRLEAQDFGLPHDALLQREPATATTISVCLVRAVSLKPTERGRHRDPFVVLTIGTKQTKSTVKRGLDPIWNERFNFWSPVKHNDLLVDVFDQAHKNERLGSSTIPLSGLTGATESRVVQLLGKGQLHLTLETCTTATTKPVHPVSGTQRRRSRTPRKASAFASSSPGKPLTASRASTHTKLPPNEDDILEIGVVRAINLREGDVLTGTNPYVVLSLRDQRRVSTPRKNTYNPVWDELFYFTVNLNGTPPGTLVVDVLDRETNGIADRSDERLGIAEIDLADHIPKDGSRQTVELALSNSRTPARIFLSLQLFSNNATVDGAPVRSLSPNNGVPDQPPDESVLTLQLIRASHLHAPGKFGGRGDPIAVLTLDGQRRQSSIRRGTSDPVWNEVFTYHVQHAGKATLFVDILDRDFIGKEDTIASGAVSIDPNWGYGATKEIVLPLAKRGTVYMQLERVPITADMLRSPNKIGESSGKLKHHSRQSNASPPRQPGSPGHSPRFTVPPGTPGVGNYRVRILTTGRDPSVPDTGLHVHLSSAGMYRQTTITRSTTAPEEFLFGVGTSATPYSVEPTDSLHIEVSIPKGEVLFEGYIDLRGLPQGIYTENQVPLADNRGKLRVEIYPLDFGTRRLDFTSPTRPDKNATSSVTSPVLKPPQTTGLLRVGVQRADLEFNAWPVPPVVRAVVQLDNQRRQTREKRLIARDPQPIWNEEFRFVVATQSTNNGQTATEALHVEVIKDEDQVIGRGVVSLHELERNRPINVSVPLQMGKLHLELEALDFGLLQTDDRRARKEHKDRRRSSKTVASGSGTHSRAPESTALEYSQVSSPGQAGYTPRRTAEKEETDPGRSGYSYATSSSNLPNSPPVTTKPPSPPRFQSPPKALPLSYGSPASKSGSSFVPHSLHSIASTYRTPR
eukprot:TRINITY_DN20855_c0_g1_i1.p1 TRINITY_DN20855_c0_g1~~TRINITY_DN20855_c0_g1_i1.p1  ORF type:complete len:1170 (-),score=190.50 TRINITY_DN20855_c0_g1_i1:147-3656(-)